MNNQSISQFTHWPCIRPILGCVLFIPMPAYSAVSTTGYVSPDPSTTTAQDDLTIGAALLDGTMTVDGGSQVFSDDAYLARYAGSTGRVTVRGAGSRWESYAIAVGYADEGFMEILDGGVVQVRSLNVGGSGEVRSGQVVVSGTDSKLIVTTLSEMSISHSGEVSILDGALFDVNSALSAIGSTVDRGSLTVSGQGTALSVKDKISSWGADILIHNGAQAESRSGRITGAGSLIPGHLTVDGAGTSWIVTEGIIVGQSHLGELHITEGAHVSAGGHVRIGLDYTGSGLVRVAGVGSSLDVSDATVHVGVESRSDFGQSGVLEILAGGTLNSRFGQIGGLYNNNGVYGEALIDGPGSSWTIGQWLYVGYDNDNAGTMVVSNGGALHAANAVINDYSTADSSAAVTGAGSSWTTTGQFLIGRGAGGTFTASSGGRVTSNSVIVGERKGVANISGEGTAWQINSGLTIGVYGDGAFNQSGGVVDILDGNIKITSEVGIQSSAPQHFIPVPLVYGTGIYHLSGGRLDLHGNNIDLGLGNAVFNHTGGELQNLGTMINQGGELTSEGVIFTINLDGDYIQQADGTLTIELGGTAAGVDHDVLAVAGAAQLGGTLSIVLTDDFVPTLNQSFTVLTSGGLNGSRFDIVAGNPYTDGLMFVAMYTDTDVQVASRRVGDADFDGDIDGFDLTQFFANFTGPNLGPPAGTHTDIDGDGDVDGVDLGYAFGAFTGPVSPANVPEPASLILLTLAGLFATRRRRGPLLQAEQPVREGNIPGPN